MDVDDLFVEIGQFGPYQICQYLILSFPIMCSAYQTITFVFMTTVPAFRCFVSECEYKNTKQFWTPWLNSSIPFENGQPHQCERYKPFLNLTSTFSELCSIFPFSDEGEIIGCDSYIFSPGEITVASEFGIVCEESNWKIFVLMAITYISFFIGMPIAGFISDKFGRRKVLIYSWFLQSLIAIIQSFTINYDNFIILQALAAFTCGAYNAGFVMAIESLGPTMRLLGNVLVCCLHALGQCNVALTMWLTKDWRVMNRVLFIPGLLAPVYFWLLPESVRWLMSKGKTDEAITIFRNIARFNNRHLTRQFENNVKILSEVNIVRPPSSVHETHSREQIVETPYGCRRGNSAQNSENRTQNSTTGLEKLLKSEIVIVRLFCCTIVWASISMLFHGLTLKSMQISGNKYLNFILTVVVEIPGYMISYYLVEIIKIGRKLSLHLTITLTGLCCYLFFFIQEYAGYPIGEKIIFLIAKLLITFSFSIVYLHTAEMFPMEIRNAVVAICSMSGHVGTILAPATLLLITSYDSTLIWGIVAVVSGLIACLLPETNGAKLPWTFTDAEQL